VVDELRSLLNNESWLHALADEFEKPYMGELALFLRSEIDAGKKILPPKPNWFEALNNTPLDKIKVVILGQDPYPTAGHAHGLCFSVPPDVKPLPKSLVNIYKEMQDDIGVDNSHTGYLLPWAHQGILMLNTVLTVEESNTNAHKAKGWEYLTDAIIDIVNQKCQNIVFVLWGAHAQQKVSMIDSSRHHILFSPHPSPLSAYRGFWGSKPFSGINKYLSSVGKKPINWQL
jgi:uracil-DNA glycosylase